EELVFYKTKENVNPDPATGHMSIALDEIQLFNSEGTNWQYTGDGTNNYHTAELFDLLDYSGGGSGSSDCPGCGPLPVELISFRGNLKNKEVFLSWKTASEINNDYFTLEKSSNGIQFDRLTKVKGQGSSSEFQQYNYVDQKPFEGINYYRLSQTDFDGTTYFASNIIAIENQEENSLNIFPNPASTRLFIRSINSEKKQRSYQIFDAVGHLVLEGILALEENGSSSFINIENLTNGLYLIQFTDDTSSESMRFIKE
ncbi:MAG: T9SS type A sorting domain-containing protein, partial [Saprospiraceae bacterium]